ncbi:MAG: hypothetical protein ACLP52_30530 [Streptosporangiaceae bacterium]
MSLNGNNNGDQARKHPRSIDPGWATVLAAIILAAGGVAGVFIGRATASGKSHGAGTTTPRPALAFSQSSPATIPWCSTLSGSGLIPKGYRLAIFDSSVQSQLHFHFDGFARRTSANSWSLFPLYIGTSREAGLKDIIGGSLVTDGMAAYISSIVAGPPKVGAVWVSTALPAGLQRITLKVKRNADSAQCAAP